MFHRAFAYHDMLLLVCIWVSEYIDVYSHNPSLSECVSDVIDFRIYRIYILFYNHVVYISKYLNMLARLHYYQLHVFYATVIVNMTIQKILSFSTVTLVDNVPRKHYYYSEQLLFYHLPQVATLKTIVES
jgi:hypothetical protein